MKSTRQLHQAARLIKYAENINMAQPQDTGLAALLGGVSPVLSGIYGGAKGDSATQGLRSGGSSLAGHLGGGAVGGVSGALLAMLAAKLTKQDAASTGTFTGMGAGLGAALGGAIGGGVMSHGSAKKYNNKLESYRRHQKELSGGSTVNVYNDSGEKKEDEDQKSASHYQNQLQIIKVAGLGTMVGKGIIKGVGNIMGRNGKLVTQGTADALMNPALHSILGRGAIGAGAGALALGGAGYGMGNRQGVNTGMQQGYGQGFNAGGNDALMQAGGALDQTYGGFGGRFNALMGGARPGQDAIMQLMQQYQMPQQNQMSPQNQYGEPWDPMQMNINQRWYK